MSRVSGLAERLRILILQGEIAPGGSLVEVVLAERFRTTQSALREALRLLEGRGLLVADYSGGMRVVAVDARGLADALEVRAALEGLCAAAAAGRSREGGLEPQAVETVLRLIDAVETAQAENRPEAAIFADRTLHLAIGALAGNQAAYVALDHLWDRIVVARAHSGAWRSPGEAARREHHELIAGIAGGHRDEAAGIARRHALGT